MDQITTQQALAVIGIFTALFWSSFYLGQIWSLLKDHGKRLDHHDREIAKLNDPEPSHYYGQYLR
jgi:hypothetical protein